MRRYAIGRLALLGLWKLGLLVRLILSFRVATRLLTAAASIAIMALPGIGAVHTGDIKATLAARSSYRSALATDTKDWAGPVLATASDVSGRDQEPGYVYATYSWTDKHSQVWQITGVWAADMKAIHNRGHVLFWWYIGNDNGYNDPSYDGVFVAPIGSHQTPLSMYYGLSPQPWGSDVFFAWISAWFVAWWNLIIVTLLSLVNVLVWRHTRRPSPVDT